MVGLSLITCSYNTPKITETMLKSFRNMHKELNDMDLVLIENSTNEETQMLLDEYDIPYTKNPGGTHAKSLDIAFGKCMTKYALVVDTDIIFKKNIVGVFGSIQNNKTDLLGIECGDRGGYKLMPRIHPWFMFVNIESISKHGIRFYSEDRIFKSKSEGFYNNIPINNYRSPEPMYDVGATFYEDIKNVGLKISNTPIIQAWFEHYEGSSWQRVSGHEGFEQLGNHVWQNYQKEIELVKNVDIRNFYK